MEAVGRVGHLCPGCIHPPYVTNGTERCLETGRTGYGELGKLLFFCLHRFSFACGIAYMVYQEDMQALFSRCWSDAPEAIQEYIAGRCFDCSYDLCGACG